MATKKTKKIYEMSFHLIPAVNENAGKKFEDIKAVISNSGEIISAETPERIPLTYTIRHNVRKQDGSYNRYDEAFFGSVKFKAENRFAEDLRRRLQADEDILRFLIVETVEEETRIGEVLPGVEEEKDKDAEGSGRKRGARNKEAVKERKGETDEVKNATMEKENK